MRSVLLLALTALISACGAAKDNPAPPASAEAVVGWSAVAGAPRIGPKDSRVVDVDLKVNVTDGWHVYSLTQLTGGPTPMSVTVASPYQLAGGIKGPSPVKAQDNNFGIQTETYSGAQSFRFAVEIANTAGDLPPIEFKVRSQACSDKLCLPAKTQTITVKPGSSTT
jgi:thiol:disulfide interchange protein DsbD